MPLFGKKKDSSVKKGKSSSSSSLAKSGGRKSKMATYMPSPSGGVLDFAPKVPVMQRDYKPPPNLAELRETLEKLTAMDKYVFSKGAGKKAPKLLFKCDLELMEVHWYEAKKDGEPGRHIGTMEFMEINEVRTGAMALNSKDFRQASLDKQSAKLEPLAVTIMHGKLFRLKQLCIICNNALEADAWSRGLWHFSRIMNPKLYRAHLQTDYFLRRRWHGLTAGKTKPSIGMRDLVLFLQKINLKMPKKELKDIFVQVDQHNLGLIGEREFRILYHLLGEMPEVEAIFSKFSSSGSKKSLSAKDIVTFYHKEQDQHDFPLELAERIIEDFGDGGASLSLMGFIEYLHSEMNEAFNPEHDLIYQDMNAPLAQYFIASSHNTYLMGDQIRSESSVEAYVRCLREGCRCVEIDCWNGSTAEMPIVVYHGHTLTSKIKFEDVLVAIKQHAFVASEYPLILSIENHCGLSQQLRMAKAFVATFGDWLVTEPLPDCNEPDRDCYPSPEQLKGRIIIKHKKLSAEGDSVDGGHKMEDDISSSIKNGYLLLEDKVDFSWNRHFFVLTDSKIFYAEAMDEEMNAEEEEEDVVGLENTETRESELHYNEPWFHGQVKGGRTTADQLLRAFNPQEGTFLVRESDTFPGEYSLSFWHAGASQHCRMRCKNGKYFLTDQISFVNLYELIEYYRREPLKSASFSLVLGTAVPQPAPHETQKWFHKVLSRPEAEDMLKRIRADGAFLIRVSETSKDWYTVSFRAEGKIKHCRIEKQGRMYCIGDAEFESMVKLVEYYEKHPLYRKMKLKYPVDQELIDRQGLEPEEDIYNSDELYQEPNAFEGQDRSNSSNVTCRALYSYAATQPDELTFPKDAIITHVVKKDGGWWQGDYGETIGGWLPSNYVEEIDHDALAEEDKEDGDNPLGSLEKAVMDVRGLRVLPQASVPQQRLIFRILSDDNPNNYLDVGAESEEDMREWAEKIHEAAQAAEQKHRDKQQQQKKLKIHRELSDLIFYSHSVSFKGFQNSKDTAEYQHMSSFAEKKAMALSNERSGQPLEFNEYNCRQLSRIYPNGKRVDSSNYDPQLLWNCGCQMVALNYQYPDKNMWLNHGKFRANGRCGLLKKSFAQCHPTFHPYEHKSFAKMVEPATIRIKIISGRHLVKTTSKGIASPFVEVEAIGTESQKYKTQTVHDNGFAAVWNESFVFNVSMPDLTCLRWTVYDEDMFQDAHAIGQNVLPLGVKSDRSIRCGYRSVPLKNVYNEPLELSSLLVHISVSYGEGVKDKKFQGLQDTKDKLRKLGNVRDEMVKEKVIKSKKGEEVDQAFDKKLQETNAQIRKLEEKIMNNPLERAKSKHQAKTSTVDKKKRK